MFNKEIWIVIFLLLLTWFLAKEKRYRWFYIIYKTWHRDISGLIRSLKAIVTVLLVEFKQDTIPKLFTKTARRVPNRVAFYFEDETWTFQQIEETSNKISNYFLNAGYQKGDTVALLLENRPEYVAIWLGLAKIGVKTALINTNLVSKSLQHCVSVVNARGFIFGSDFGNTVHEILKNLGDTSLYQFNTSSVSLKIENAVDLKQGIESHSSQLPENQMKGTKVNDTILYIYTSGTTGLPKAAKITSARCNFMSTSVYYLLQLEDKDVFYNPLPLYHASGGMMTLGLCLIFGLSMVIRKKFSASNFWTDCIKYNCTASTYIGETCRYIVAANKGQTNIKHNVRKLYGNGLKKEVWKEFVETFNHPQIFEGYGSTEGNVNIMNVDGKLGAVGFMPFLLAPLSPLVIIKYNEETNEPIKDSKGFCIECENDEPGLLLGKIYRKLTTCQFEGYADKKETNKKILTNVFKKGDAFFNTGDLMVKDELNYFYFKDRIGDTYRWKGENVATTEVEFIASEIIGPKDIVVYGVEVPHFDGKAGMIGILKTENDIDTKLLAEGFKSHLPAYAIPLFLRILDTLPLTTTFKVKKVELQKEGFNINNITDPLYIFDSKLVDYVPLHNVYNDIMSGLKKL